MTTTTNIEKTARTARQTAEVQRDSYEALAKSFSAMQRRNVEFAQMWMTGVYRTFFPFTYAIYAQDGLKAAQKRTEQALETTQQALEATQQVAQQGLRVAEEATAKAEKATVKAEKATVKAEEAAVKAEKATMEAKQATSKSQAATQEAALRDEEETREAALQAAVHRSLNTKNYEELNVDQVSKKLDGLSATELKKVREYEMHNKSRETLIKEIDRRLSVTS